MKIEKIAINKTPEQPEGIEIEVIQPENKLEEGVMNFLMTSFLRDLKRDGRIPYELPERFRVEYRTNGTFVAFGGAGDSAYYEPPKPLAIFGLRHLGGRFDLIHAAPVLHKPQPAPETKDE